MLVYFSVSSYLSSIITIPAGNPRPSRSYSGPAFASLTALRPYHRLICLPFFFFLSVPLLSVRIIDCRLPLLSHRTAIFFCLSAHAFSLTASSLPALYIHLHLLSFFPFFWPGLPFPFHRSNFKKKGDRERGSFRGRKRKRRKLKKTYLKKENPVSNILAT